jgi:hypothetical protein
MSKLFLINDADTSDALNATASAASSLTALVWAKDPKDLRVRKLTGSATAVGATSTALVAAGLVPDNGVLEIVRIFVASSATVARTFTTLVGDDEALPAVQVSAGGYAEWDGAWHRYNSSGEVVGGLMALQKISNLHLQCISGEEFAEADVLDLDT